MQEQNFDFLYIGVGGTGARVIESLVWLSFIGYFRREREVKFLLIDQDRENGNLIRAQETIKLYNELREKVNITNKERFAFFVTKFEDIYPRKSPFVPLSEGTFRDIISNERKKYEKLINFLYTNEQLNFDLKEGFRGLPAIGTLSVGKEIENNYQSIFGNINNNSRICICGSVFGGTGASILPILPGIIKRKEQGKEIKIMNIMVLPYFKVREGLEDKISPTGSSFPFKSVLAFDYHAYLNKKNFEGFEGADYACAIGLPDIFQMDSDEIEYSLGGSSQENPAHFIEALTIIFAKHLVDGFDEKIEEKSLYLIGLIEDNQHYIYNLYEDDKKEIRDLILRLDSGLLASVIISHFIEEDKNKNKKLLGKLFKEFEKYEPNVLTFAQSYIKYYFSVRYSLLSKSRRKYKGQMNYYQKKALEEIKKVLGKRFEHYLSNAYSKSETILDTYENLIKNIYGEIQKDNKIRQCLEKVERG